MSARELIALAGLWSVTAAGASEVKIFKTDTQEAVLAGTLEGLSVDSAGTIELARRLERKATIEEPFVFSAAAHPEGWVVGTGSSGKVLLVSEDGEVTALHSAEEQIFAVAVEDDGSVLAASAPGGKVYRIAGGDAEVIFDAEVQYVWDLERDAKGRLLVATGLPGRLYRVGRSGKAEVLYSSPDSHVRTISVQPNGDVLLGTAGEGLVVRVTPAGEATTLHDAVHPEVLAIVPGAGGVAYAAVLASEASFVDLSSSRGSSGKDGEESGETGTVTVEVASPETVGSRSGSFSGPRSVIVEISPEGQVSELVSLESETVHALLYRDEGLWIGTGQDGKLYRWSDRQLVHEATLEERQIVALVAGPAGTAVVTTNAAALYRLHSDLEESGTYTSSVLDAAQVASFGSFLWRGEQPPGATVELAFRSGVSASPDATWTSWTSGTATRCTDCEKGAGRGQEAALAEVASGRYVQWRARFERGRGAGPRLEASELTYRQENLRPKIGKLETLDPGEILVPSSFNPQNQTFEPWSPNREGIFTTLRLEKGNDGDGRLKSLWKKGYRTLQWSAEDGNQDELSYRLELRMEERDGDWLPMVGEIEDSHYSFDSTVLPDGRYRFRLTASDGGNRLEAEALTDTKVSETVVVDHTPPALVSRKRSGSTIEVELRDALSPIRSADSSVDVGEWRLVRAADGLLDGRRETLRLEVPAGARVVLLRVSDAAHNVVTFDLLAPPTP